MWRALLIGTSEYHRELPLPGPVANVGAIAAALVGGRGALYDKAAVLTMVDPSGSDLELGLHDFLKTASVVDRLLIYIACHAKDIAGNLYLYPADVDLSQGELPAGALEAAKIASWFDDSDADEILLVLECCDAGSIITRHLDHGKHGQTPNRTVVATVGPAEDAPAAAREVRDKHGRRSVSSLLTPFAGALLGALRDLVAEAERPGHITIEDVLDRVDPAWRTDRDEGPRMWRSPNSSAAPFALAVASPRRSTQPEKAVGTANGAGLPTPAPPPQVAIVQPSNSLVAAKLSAAWSALPAWRRRLSQDFEPRDVSVTEYVTLYRAFELWRESRLLTSGTSLQPLSSMQSSPPNAPSSLWPLGRLVAVGSHQWLLAGSDVINCNRCSGVGWIAGCTAPGCVNGVNVAPDEQVVCAQCGGQGEFRKTVPGVCGLCNGTKSVLVESGVVVSDPTLVFGQTHPLIAQTNPRVIRHVQIAPRLDGIQDPVLPHGWQRNSVGAVVPSVSTTLCPQCSGSGEAFVQRKWECENCHGTRHAPHTIRATDVCARCKGRSMHPCESCAGTGKLLEGRVQSLRVRDVTRVLPGRATQAWHAVRLEVSEGTNGEPVQLRCDYKGVRVASSIVPTVLVHQMARSFLASEGHEAAATPELLSSDPPSVDSLLETKVVACPVSLARWSAAGREQYAVVPANGAPIFVDLLRWERTARWRLAASTFMSVLLAVVLVLKLR